jgi:hypothetical protein
MKKTIWLCDVCGSETNPGPEGGNVRVDFSLTGKQVGTMKSYNAIVCEKCAIKPVNDVLTALLAVAKAETGGVNIAAITLCTLNVDGSIKGVSAKA